MKPKAVLVMLDPLSLPRLEAIAAYAREHHWALILEDRLPPDLDLGRLDGAITSLRTRKDQIARVRQLLATGKPVVDLTVACREFDLPRVVSDHRALGEVAARHFLEHGFAHFAWYSSGWSAVHELRYAGFSETLGRPIPKICLGAPLPLPCCVLCFSESDAARLIEDCRSRNLDVPGDVAVLGIGNDPFLCEGGETSISSVDQDLGGAAREACALLDRMMAGEPMPRDIQLIPPRGVIARKSTDTLAHADPMVRAILVYIHKNLNRTFGAAEIAAELNLSRSTSDHRFTAAVGHSIGREILNQRLQRAKRLLQDPSVALKDISAACGFCNPSFFTNVFKRETGLRPKDWRKQQRSTPSSEKSGA
ncbi:MAG: helix-turn-helix domain-containing protein [bacterium]|nr:helix-turn-helix domain-containing protein [bacterium]